MADETLYTMDESFVALNETFQSLLRAGFTENQAIQITIGVIVKAAAEGL